MKSKDGKSPRPKSHYIFQTDTIKNVDEYAGLMKRLIEAFPDLHFDPSVKSPAQLNFGVKDAQVSYVNGEMNLTGFLKTLSDSKMKMARHNEIDIIPEGQRNSALCSYAATVLKRWGDESAKSYELFLEKASKCSPPLEDEEINLIWNGAASFYRKTIQSSLNYIPPDQFIDEKVTPKLKPDDFTDVGQAQVFSQVYAARLRYSESTKYLFYAGTVWVENEIKAHGLVQSLTENQLQEARKELKEAQKLEDTATVNGNRKEIENAKKFVELAKEYRKYALSCRHSLRIKATLKEAQPMLEIDAKKLDSDYSKLNTPMGTVDLQTANINVHNPTDYCTKITAVSPGNEGVALFSEFMKKITCNDDSLEEYLQIVAGMCAVGKVFCENLVIAYGSGRNGKSTFFNLLARVMGDYSGNLSAETLTANCRKNKSPEYAELRGKRLVIAAELEESMRLDTSIVKKLCSTDSILAEKKYKDPFSFTPSHTVILYTNHLPKVGTTDEGTWRRLIVVPFKAVIEGDTDIKNYADYLFEHAGGAVLSWIIEGAKRFIKSNYTIELPEVVKQAIEEYRAENNWINNFIFDKCEIDRTFVQPAGEFYSHYREYCESIGERFIRSNAEFKKAIEGAGYPWKREKTGAYYRGLRVRDESQPAKGPFVDTSEILPCYNPDAATMELAMVEDDDEYVEF